MSKRSVVGGARHLQRRLRRWRTYLSPWSLNYAMWRRSERPLEESSRTSAVMKQWFCTVLRSRYRSAKAIAAL